MPQDFEGFKNLNLATAAAHEGGCRGIYGLKSRGDGACGSDCRLHQVPAVVPVRGFARLSPRARGGEKVHRSIVIAQMSRRDASGGERIAQGDGLAQFLREHWAFEERISPSLDAEYLAADASKKGQQSENLCRHRRAQRMHSSLL